MYGRSPLAPVLGIHPAVVYKAARRGAAQAGVWQQCLTDRPKAT
jgi:hypothetical protein